MQFEVKQQNSEFVLFYSQFDNRFILASEFSHLKLWLVFISFSAKKISISSGEISNLLLPFDIYKLSTVFPYMLGSFQSKTKDTCTRALWCCSNLFIPEMLAKLLKVWSCKRQKCMSVNQILSRREQDGRGFSLVTVLGLKLFNYLCLLYYFFIFLYSNSPY